MPVDAAHNRSGPVARCLQGTRETLIATIMQWIDEGSNRPICWLNGPAGSGKSAVSQTVAELCEAHNKLAASYFFFRGAGERSRITHFIPTLAYQLSISVPTTKPFIQRVIHNDPYTTRRALRHQFQKLLIEPMLAVTDPNLEPTTTMVILIDALDECDDKELMAEFIEIITDACQGNDQFPFRIFFTSRVEEHLRKKFESPVARSVMYPLSLPDFDAGDDIRKFFRSRFAIIYQENHRLMRDVPLPWPSDRDLEALVKKASDSFIFAFTLINFVNDGNDLPHRKLPIALRAHAGLDPLYTQVLSATPHSQNFDRVIGTIILLESPLSVASLGHLLQLSTADILHAILGIQSILLIPGDDDQSVQLFHTSLRDFLMTKLRSGDFFINPPIRHLWITIDCLKVMAKPLGRDIIFSGEVLRYACNNWCHHFGQSLTEENDILDALFGGSFKNCLINFVSKSFDFWINTWIFHGRWQEMLACLWSVRSKLEQIQYCPQELLKVFHNMEEKAKLDTVGWSTYRFPFGEEFSNVTKNHIHTWRNNQHK